MMRTAGEEVKSGHPGEGSGGLLLPLKLKSAHPLLFLGIYSTNVVSLPTYTRTRTHTRTLFTGALFVIVEELKPPRCSVTVLEL